ncbi:JAB domain-containing protein [Burkholderia glumae]|uniref:RadC family protein n=1 Tax=Burkholderia glumae TaxID=337 RepID=UPI000F5FC591|nr:DNA repair protein RadC [Burkholderia glumae]MCQ0029228.1 DNA repair protein RadC [Burkholderia glumae]MCQ0036874.1 DNA repair protein RadC [Burkholderia glumae]QJW80277.1 DNA repair protein RadC [Burkholderia glumae]RQZ75600.1 JAB domain-containing protein [Burkholderia glumae]UVS85391.1 JAB domain-containing protein [Burkholderia glumae]
MRSDRNRMAGGPAAGHDPHGAGAAPGPAPALRPPAAPPGRQSPCRRHNEHHDRPRERLLDRGPAALADHELLALLLGNGIAGPGTAGIAGSVLRHFGSLRALLDASPGAISALPGIGPARTAVLLATTELVRRALVERASERPLVDSPGAVEDYLRLTIGTRAHEVFVCLYLDAQHRLVHDEEATHGTLTRMAVYPREIVRRALELKAAALIVAHNHPSGAVRPSAEDRRLTRVLHDALALVDVRLIDHIVVGASETFSFAQAGLM